MNYFLSMLVQWTSKLCPFDISIFYLGGGGGGGVQVHFKVWGSANFKF